MVVALKIAGRERQDTPINKLCVFEGGGGSWGQRGESSQKTVFPGKRHDNRILKVHILLSRNVVVIAQAPKRESTCLACLSFPFFPRLPRSLLEIRSCFGRGFPSSPRKNLLRVRQEERILVLGGLFSLVFAFQRKDEKDRLPRKNTQEKSLTKSRRRRASLDDRQITHLICVFLRHLPSDFFRGCFGPPSCFFLI